MNVIILLRDKSRVPLRFTKFITFASSVRMLPNVRGRIKLHLNDHLKLNNLDLIFKSAFQKGLFYTVVVNK